MGWEARTTNAQEMTANAVIPNLWHRVRTENTLARVPSRADSDIYALYTEYESDKNGAYTYVLGVRVNSENGVPAGMVMRRVPEGDYALLAVRDHPAPTAVVGLWQQIWKLEDARQISRAYRTDYEVHHFEGKQESAVELYIALKK